MACDSFYEYMYALSLHDFRLPNHLPNIRFKSSEFTLISHFHIISCFPPHSLDITSGWGLIPQLLVSVMCFASKGYNVKIGFF